MLQPLLNLIRSDGETDSLALSRFHSGGCRFFRISVPINVAITDGEGYFFLIFIEFVRGRIRKERSYYDTRFDDSKFFPFSTSASLF